MAKTVDNFATIEDFRKQYNELAYDVGDTVGLNASMKSGSNDTIVDALNVLDDKQFFLQEFVYVAAGANEVTFTGADSFSNTLLFRKDKIQVYKNERHLVEDVDYIVASPDGSGNHASIVLQGTYASGQANAIATNDRVTIYSYTGAFIGTEISGTASSFFQKSGSGNNEIYNSNAGGIILNGDNSSATTELESGYTVQLAGKTFAEDDIITTVAGKKFQAPILSDSIASLTAGSLTGAVNITASGTVQAEQLTTTDDLSVGDDLSVTGLATIGETLEVTGNTTLTGNLSVEGNTTLGNQATDTITFGGTVDSNITPTTNNTQQVGISSRKFTAMHATTFHGALSGESSTTGSISGHSVSTLSDVTISSPQSGHHLTWSGSAWTNSAAGSTDTISEGSSNLWYTDARVSTRVGTILQHGNHTNITATTVGNEVRFSAAATYGDSDVQSYLSEGPGIDLSNAGKISAEVENGIKLGAGDSDKLQLDYSVITDGDLSGGLPSGSGKSVGHLYFLI